MSDLGTWRVLKFTHEGELLKSWEVDGLTLGDSRGGIAVDGFGTVYVATGSIRWGMDAFIWMYDSEGQFLGALQPFHGVDHPTGIAAGNVSSGHLNVYTASPWNRAIVKYTLQYKDGVPREAEFAELWTTGDSSDAGQFASPHGVAVDSLGNVYVADTGNDRVQKFDSSGVFLAKWGSRGGGNGEFREPTAIAVDSLGNVYVADRRNDRVQKFDSRGSFLAKWGSEGDGNGQFKWPTAIAADKLGHVYVADRSSARIQKFDSSGAFLGTWGSEGVGNSQFKTPTGIAVDMSGSVYVVDSGNHRIQKFDADGGFLGVWGSEGSGAGQFNSPTVVAVDGSGNVYVADAGDPLLYISNDRIQKFDADGVFLGMWGSEGSGHGEFRNPWGMAVDISGNVYVADTGNARIQKFRPVTLTAHNKSIVIAGGGPFPGNTLWGATQMCANYAYRTLSFQGFTKATTYYLSSNTDLDLDNNGEADDVDGDVTKAGLEYALTSWAVEELGGLPTGDVVIYLVDHGGDGTFRLNATETLTAVELDGWLDTMQAGIEGDVTIVYDACESGSFVEALHGPGRTIIASTSPGEYAHFVTQGAVSFSNFFWTEVFNGLDVSDAFSFASEALGTAIESQHPMLDADGDGVANETDDFALMTDVFIGNGTDLFDERPEIGSVSAAQTIQDTVSATLSAFDVTDEDGISRVWAIIRPPDYRQDVSDNPVVRLPQFELWPEDGTKVNWSAAYDGFTVEGTYQIAIYAKDANLNTSYPQLTTVNVNSPLRRKALIVAGGPTTNSIWPAVSNVAQMAYNALRFQSYLHEDIQYLSADTDGDGVDGAPSVANIQEAISVWAAEETQDLVVYFVGKAV